MELFAGRFVSNGSKQLGFSPAPISYALASNDMDGNSYEDIVYCCGMHQVQLLQLDTTLSSYMIGRREERLIRRQGMSLDGKLPCCRVAERYPVVGYPFGSYDKPHNEDPAVLIEPDGTLEAYCAQGDCSANSLRYGVFANFDENSGADAFVLPSEMQPLAWDINGDAFGNWPPQAYSGGGISSSISPTSLGNIDNAIYDDVLFSTCLDGNCTILVYNYLAAVPSSLDFPITLPENVLSYGGFSIADI